MTTNLSSSELTDTQSPYPVHALLFPPDYTDTPPHSLGTAETALAQQQ
jgi:hypothetical protein